MHVLQGEARLVDLEEVPEGRLIPLLLRTDLRDPLEVVDRLVAHQGALRLTPGQEARGFAVHRLGPAAVDPGPLRPPRKQVLFQLAAHPLPFGRLVGKGEGFDLLSRLTVLPLEGQALGRLQGVAGLPVGASRQGEELALEEQLGGLTVAAEGGIAQSRLEGASAAAEAFGLLLEPAPVGLRGSGVASIAGDRLGVRALLFVEPACRVVVPELVVAGQQPGLVLERGIQPGRLGPVFAPEQELRRLDGLPGAAEALRRVAQLARLFVEPGRLQVVLPGLVVRRRPGRLSGLVPVAQGRLEVLEGLPALRGLCVAALLLPGLEVADPAALFLPAGCPQGGRPGKEAGLFQALGGLA